MKPEILSKDKESALRFFKSREDLEYNYEEYEKFVNGCVDLVGRDGRYSRVIAILRGERGLESCAFFGALSGDGVELQMHHGPLFTLFDICDIVTRWLMFNDDQEITTMKVANIVLKEHEENNIQLVSLSKLVHQDAVHNGSVFLHIKSAVGRIDRFIYKYMDGIETENIQNIIYYLKMCLEYHDHIDNGLFEVAEQLESFKNIKIKK